MRPPRGAAPWAALARALRLAAGVALVAAGASGPARAAQAVVEDTLAQRLVPCTLCHGKEGLAASDGFYPRIAGKPAAYLLHQLDNFREGRRHYGPMVALVGPLSQDYRREIAEYFAALDLPYPPPQRATAGATLLGQGERLAREGDPERQLPACTACHGAALTGMLPATPGLLGLPRDYVAAQLGAWLSGQRRAHAPDCMAEIARRLSGDDVAALSQWLAAQPVPVPSRAAPPVAGTLPLRCGSVERAGR